jgi:L-cysteine:1D-myo-inositol 2-amino-2-deoxy-alpha-D-glucopyranoside ligase
VRLFDTRRREVVDFAPGDEVKMYVCGVTPYDATHLGHAFTFVTYDVLIRRLIDTGRTVKCVRNVTDVDDPLFAKARELGMHYLDLAAREEQRLEDDLRAMNFIPMHSTPRASSAIADIRGFIGMVLDRGYAYEAGGSVYFDVGRFADFGSISHYDRTKMLMLARERGGNVDDPNKRDPLDFVLWQPSAPDEPSWDTMWGSGRPGWHIECSALALRELGTTIDLHGGGTDLIYPHHECERAQSEAATGQPFVRHWMHVAMVWMDGYKMSKSRGNLVFVDALRKRYDPRAIRLGLIVNHYRTEWEWDEGLIDRATDRLGNWVRTAVDSGKRKSSAREESDQVTATVRRHLDADLDTPGAVAVIDAAAASGIDVSEAAGLLGVNVS